MHWRRKLIERRIDLILLASLAGLLVGLGIRTRRLYSINWQSSTETGLPGTVVLPEQRFAGLETTIVRGLQWRDGQGRWEMTAETFDIRKPSLKFMRVGAFNEALITDLRIMVDAAFLAADASNDSATPTVRAAWIQEGGMASFLSAVWLDPLIINRQVSGLRIRNLSIFSRASDGSEQLVLQCDEAILSGRKNNLRLRLRGEVRFSNIRAEEIICRQADITPAAGSLQVMAREPTLHAAGKTQRLARISFPLTALVIEPDFSQRVPQPSGGPVY